MRWNIRILVIQAVFATTLLGNSGNAQVKSVREIYIDLNLSGISLKSGFDAIESLTDLTFSYDERLVEERTQLFTYQKNEGTVAEFLLFLSREFDLSFQQVNNVINARQRPVQLNRNRVDVIIDQVSVSGTVKDENGEPLPGVTILQKGTSTGTITDAEGKFQVSVQEGAILVFSFVGYKTQEVIVAGQTTMEVSLTPDWSSLEEVVVVGYGTQKRSDVTGSVVSVPEDRLSNLPVTNLMHAIQGTAAGLNITQNSSVPGSSGTMQIRGINSINANTSPFIVLDGVPFFGSTNDINPADIQSIEILKDASATAIYGTRASNGVILITTRRGSSADGKPTIKYSGYQGFESIPNPLEPMGPDQYVQKYADFLEANNQAQTAVLPNTAEVENYDAGITTDWLDEATRPGKIQEHSLSISGGTNRVQYYVSGTHLAQQGVVRGYQYKKTSFRANVDSKVTDFLKVGTSAFFTENNYDGGRVNLLEATAMSPYSVPEDENGNYIIYPMSPEQLFLNPLLGLTVDRLDRGRNLTGTSYAELTPGFVKGLKYRLNASYAFNLNRTAQYGGRQFNDQSGTADVSNSETSNWVVENILQYGRDFGKHHIDITALYSAQKVDYFQSESQSRGFINDALSYNNMSAGVTQSTDSEANGYAIASQMGRVNYSYDGRYLLTVTARRDGYSAFGANTDKYGLFPSMAIGWNIHNEQFLQAVNSINQLKLRFSLGQTGNQAIPVNLTATTATPVQYPFGGTALTGVLYDTLGNANLNWETTTAANIALDFGVLNGRIGGTIEMYKTTTEDILLKRNLPAATGYDDVWVNLGEMQNVGLEVTLTTVNVDRGNFSWRTNLNFSSYRNKILELYGDGTDDIGNEWFIGEPLRVIYDYKKVGIWQEGEDIASVDPVGKPGDLKFQDQDGVVGITADDRVILGQQDPKWIGGITNTFQYKSWSLSVFIQTSQGGMKSNRDLSYADEAGRRNLPADFQYWTPENRDNYWPSLAAYTNYKGYQFAENFSYVRIKDVRIAYSLPANLVTKYGLQGLTIYAAGRNLHTFTDWYGWDPEINYEPRGTGEWRNNYPLVRTISIGLNLSI